MSDSGRTSEMLSSRRETVMDQAEAMKDAVDLEDVRTFVPFEGAQLEAKARAATAEEHESFQKQLFSDLLSEGSRQGVSMSERARHGKRPSDIPAQTGVPSVLLSSPPAASPAKSFQTGEPSLPQAVSVSQDGLQPEGSHTSVSPAVVAEPVSRHPLHI